MTRETSPIRPLSMHTACIEKLRAYLASKALHHRLPLPLRVVRPPASAECALEVLPIRVPLIPHLLPLPQSTLRRDSLSWTVTHKVPLREELELFVVGMARNGTCRTDARRRGRGRGASEAEVDGLADGPEAVSAGAEGVGECSGGFGKERVLLFEVPHEGGWRGHGG